MSEQKTRRLLCNAEQVRAIERGATRFTRAAKAFNEFQYPVLHVKPGGNSDRYYVDTPDELCVRVDIRCPFGIPGDRLWIAEKWANPSKHGQIAYRAEYTDNTTFGWKWRSSATMPRWASRRELEVADVGVCRLRDISEKHARDNGVLLTGVTRYGCECRNALYAMLPEIELEDWVWNVTTRRTDA